MPRAEIATTQAKYTFDQLHAELAGKVAENKREGEQLAEALQHVEATLELLDPDYSLRRISIRRRKPNPYFKRGTVFREALTALRLAARPLTAHELTLAMLTAKGRQERLSEGHTRSEGAVRSSLRIHSGDVVEGASKHPVKWKLRSD